MHIDKIPKWPRAAALHHTAKAHSIAWGPTWPCIAFEANARRPTPSIPALLPRLNLCRALQSCRCSQLRSGTTADGQTGGPDLAVSDHKAVLNVRVHTAGSRESGEPLHRQILSSVRQSLPTAGQGAPFVARLTGSHGQTACWRSRPLAQRHRTRAGCDRGACTPI